MGSVALIGSRLKLARESSGLSTRAAAQRLRVLGIAVSHATIRNYEVARTSPSTEVLAALAQVYERPQEWFLADGPTFSHVRYRCLKSVRVTQKRRYEGEALAWCHAYRFVEDVLRCPLRRPPFEVAADESGEHLAMRIREHWKLGDNPVPSVVGLLEHFGIRTISVETRNRIDGFAATFEGDPVVVLNTIVSNDRLRLNAAHELAHHFYKDAQGGANLSDSEVERRALECASHLLITETALSEAFALKSMVRLVEYKERYGISLAAMIYRANAGGLISQKLYQRLWQDFARLGWRRDEPGYVPPDRPVRMETLIDAAVRERCASYRDIAAQAGLDEREVVRRVVRAMGGRAESPLGGNEGRVVSFESFLRRRTNAEDSGE